MQIAVVDPNHCEWIEVHKAGCRDLGKRKPVHYQFEAETREQIAKETAGDFIDEGSMTLEEAIGHIHFAPCLNTVR